MEYLIGFFGHVSFTYPFGPFSDFKLSSVFTSHQEIKVDLQNYRSWSGTILLLVLRFF